MISLSNERTLLAYPRYEKHARVYIYYFFKTLIINK